MTWELVTGANTAFSRLMNVPVFTTKENINTVIKQAEHGR